MKTTLLLATSALLFVSCQEKSSPTGGENKPAAPSAELSKVLATAPAGEAKAITAARSTAKPGDEITLTGRIMGGAKPFVDGRAAFIIGDPAVLTACSDNPGDNCSTPWDACCDSPEKKKSATATIQITGADGRVLAEGLEGVGGLKNLATVTVSGKVAPASSADVLIVNATALQVK